MILDIYIFKILFYNKLFIALVTNGWSPTVGANPGYYKFDYLPIME